MRRFAALDAPHPRAPKLFSSTPWRTLALESALAGHALFRRAAGPFNEPCRVYGSTDHDGLVHPDPEFFLAMAKLARRTAADARRLGTDKWSRGGRAAGRALDALEAHLRGEGALGADDLATLRAFGRALPEIESLGTELETGEFRSRMRKTVIPFLRKSLEGGRNLAASRRPAAKLLDGLTDLCGRFEAAAEAQLAGREIENAKQLFVRDWVLLLEDVERPGMHRHAEPEDPYCAAVAGLGDTQLGLKLWQGSAGLRLLFIRYPVDGKPVLARGAVFAYREHLTEEWLDDAAWANLVRRGVPQPPVWAR